MIIQWLGNAGFKIQTKNQIGDLVICMDPFTDASGIKMPHFQADILTMSCNKEPHNNFEAIRGNPFVVTNPGEYETKGTFIYGISTIISDDKGKKNHATIYKLINENISVAHLSAISETLTNEQLEKLGNVDILFVPVGGNGSLDYKKASEVTFQIEPRIVIPMYYKSEGQKTNLGDVNDFIKHCGLKSETIDKLKISRKDLPVENTKLIILSA